MMTTEQRARASGPHQIRDYPGVAMIDFELLTERDGAVVPTPVIMRGKTGPHAARRFDRLAKNMDRFYTVRAWRKRGDLGWNGATA